ncbi:MAG: hypothetical protein QXV35_05280 [Archaeoglobaceae archaeon]
MKRMEWEDAFINVWDCKAKIVIDGETLDESKLDEKQREALERLKEYVVYTENNGALNWSGRYEFSEFSLELLERILKGETEAIEEIEDASDEDIEKKAIEMLSELRDNELIEVYDSALSYNCADGCQGYHNHKYITKQNNKFYLVDDGYGHHVAFSVAGRIVATTGVTMTEISYEEAKERVVEYLRTLVDRYAWTKRELRDHGKSELKLFECDKCKSVEIVFNVNEHVCLNGGGEK